MPIISDALGERQVSESELRGLDAEADRAWTAFTAGLEWQPIAAYDRQTAATVLLRLCDTWEIGYWGEGPIDEDCRAAWRSGKDWKAGEPLGFEPDAFATISDDWREHLIAD